MLKLSLFKDMMVYVENHKESIKKKKWIVLTQGWVYVKTNQPRDAPRGSSVWASENVLNMRDRSRSSQLHVQMCILFLQS